MPGTIRSPARAELECLRVAEELAQRRQVRPVAVAEAAVSAARAEAAELGLEDGDAERRVRLAQGERRPEPGEAAAGDRHVRRRGRLRARASGRRRRRPAATTRAPCPAASRVSSGSRAQSLKAALRRADWTRVEVGLSYPGRRLYALDRVLVSRLALGAVFAASVLARIFAAFRRVTPDYFPDENTYASLSRSLAHGHLPAVRGQIAHFPALLEPLLTAPAWWFGSLETGYRVTQAINSVAISTTALVVWWGARRLGVGRGTALAASLLAVAVPDVGLRERGALRAVRLPALRRRDRHGHRRARAADAALAGALRGGRAARDLCPAPARRAHPRVPRRGAPARPAALAAGRARGLDRRPRRGRRRTARLLPERGRPFGRRRRARAERDRARARRGLDRRAGGPPRHRRRVAPAAQRHGAGLRRVRDRGGHRSPPRGDALRRHVPRPRALRLLPPAPPLPRLRGARLAGLAVAARPRAARRGDARRRLDGARWPDGARRTRSSCSASRGCSSSPARPVPPGSVSRSSPARSRSSRSSVRGGASPRSSRSRRSRSASPPRRSRPRSRAGTPGG